MLVLQIRGRLTISCAGIVQCSINTLTALRNVQVGGHALTHWFSLSFSASVSLSLSPSLSLPLSLSLSLSLSLFHLSISFLFAVLFMFKIQPELLYSLRQVKMAFLWISNHFYKRSSTWNSGVFCSFFFSRLRNDVAACCWPFLCVGGWQADNPVHRGSDKLGRIAEHSTSEWAGNRRHEQSAIVARNDEYCSAVLGTHWPA